MAFVAINSSLLTLTLKHVERKIDGSFQYRRRIPRHLQSRYLGRSFFVRSLGKNIDELHDKSSDITRRLDREWGVLGETTQCIESSNRAKSIANCLSGINLGASTPYRVTKSLTLTASLSLYLSLHPKGSQKKFRGDNERVVRKLIARIGDLDLMAISRSHVQEYRDHALRFQSTTSVRRNLQSLTAIVNKVRQEKQLQLINPFEGLGIAGEGEDSAKRMPFTLSELRIVARACRDHDDDIRHLIALQMDTGCRVAEVVGLRVEDVILDQRIPHIRIRPWGKIRTLKTAASERDIPLIGEALWAAGRAIETRQKAKDGSNWLFPRYASDREVKATHASNTLNKWLRSLEGVSRDKTTHCFRHAMRDRLRAAQVPIEIQDVIGGWGTRTIGQGYGSGYPLQVITEHMVKVGKI